MCSRYSAPDKDILDLVEDVRTQMGAESLGRHQLDGALAQARRVLPAVSLLNGAVRRQDRLLKI